MESCRNFNLLGGLGLDEKFPVSIVVGDGELIGPATDLAIFNIFLSFTLRSVHKRGVHFSAVGACEERAIGIFRFHGWHDEPILMRNDFICNLQALNNY